MADTMKMWQYANVDGNLEDTIHMGQILVRVLTVSINPVDYKLPESSMGSISYTVIAAAECAALPDGVDHEQAAAAATAATTALQSLLPGVVKPGATLEPGGCSHRLQKILIVDNVGNTSDLYDLSSTILKPGGTFAQVGIGATMNFKSIAMTMKRSLLTSVLMGGRKYYFVNAKNSTESLAQIAQWMAEGKAKAMIDGKFTFAEVPQAFRRLRKGHTRGKIAIRVAEL
ncbi:hypothetical protein DL98DRAFT_564177 [Cadophora sp. DSE1049]|nr:hypothetical protein DL98DRAFT_564177 [Cadophora sp. DSE1049]